MVNMCEYLTVIKDNPAFSQPGKRTRPPGEAGERPKYTTSRGRSRKHKQQTQTRDYRASFPVWRSASLPRREVTESPLQQTDKRPNTTCVCVPIKAPRMEWWHQSVKPCNWNEDWNEK